MSEGGSLAMIGPQLIKHNSLKWSLPLEEYRHSECRAGKISIQKMDVMSPGVQLLIACSWTCQWHTNSISIS